MIDHKGLIDSNQTRLKCILEFGTIEITNIPNRRIDIEPVERVDRE